MSKPLLLSSSLLLAAGCTTAGNSSSEEALHFDASSSMSLLIGDTITHPELEFPGFEAPEGDQEQEEPRTEEEIIDSMVDAVITFTEREKMDAVLAMRSYAMPLLPESGDGGEVPPGDCGEAPEFESLQLLDSDCPALDGRWGWEIPVDNCLVGGEEFSGVMQVTYSELQEFNVFVPQSVVEEPALLALEQNGSGLESLRYALDVSSPQTAVMSCGESFGPMSFRVTDRDTLRVSLLDETVERVHVQGMQHQMPQGSAASGHVLSNHDGYLEVESAEGEPLMASFLTTGVVAEQGDIWPNQGSIEAHVENEGVVRLRFTPLTAIDGTVEIDTPLGIRLASLSMD